MNAPAPASIVCPHCGEAHPSAFTHCPRTGKSLFEGRALIGRVFADRYRVVDLLGEGGMGAVYVAEHLLIGRQVALKRLHPELASDAKAVARFQLEARAAAATGHEHVVEVLDLGFGEDGAPFLVMELLRGRSVAEALRRDGPMPPERAVPIVGQVLSALAAVHRLGIVHRDLKPDNIFLTRRGGRSDYVKVLDFGISKMASRDDEAAPLSLTRTGVMLGTPFYMSPEQARGSKELDHRVDLYATGVILYECLTGRVPFDGANYHALLQAILAAQPEPVQRDAPAVSEALAGVVHRSFARTPADRFASAKEMHEALVPFGAAVPDEAEPVAPPTGVQEEDLDLRATTPLEPGLIARPGTVPAVVLPLPPEPVAPEPPEAQAAPESPRSLEPAPPATAPAGTAIATEPAARRARPFTAMSDDWNGVSRRSAPWPASVTSETPRATTSERRPASLAPAPPRASVSPAPPARASVAPAGPPGRLDTRTPATPRALDPRLLRGPRRAGVTQIKGSLLIAAQEYFTQFLGRAAWERSLASMPGDAREQLGGMVLALSWFPSTTLDALLDAADRAQPGLATELGAAAAARDLPVTHRILVQTATPAALVERLPQIWRAYHESSDLVCTDGGPTACRVELVDLVPDTLLHSAWLAGYLQRTAELFGARDARAQLTSARARGDESTTLVLRWR